jgi:putative sterol carrier protein
MVARFSQEWLDQRVELARALPTRPGASARVRQIVTGTPAGEVAYVEVFQDGRLASATFGAGTDDDVDVTVTQTHPDAIAIADGELDVHVAYMQGRVKVVGDMGALMAVLPVTQSSELRAVVGELAALTDA